MTGDQNTKMTEIQEKYQEKKNITKKPPQEKFPCEICNTPYSKSYLKVHMKIHEKKYKEETKISEKEEIDKRKETSSIKEQDNVDEDKNKHAIYAYTHGPVTGSSPGLAFRTCISHGFY